LSLQHPEEAVGQHLGRTDAAILDLVEQINVVTILDVAFDELTQLLLLDVAFEKDRRLSM